MGEPAETVEEEVEEEVVELTEEEKALWYRKSANPDVIPGAINRCFTKFCLPTVEEGFDDVVYEWQNQETSAKAIEEWKLAKKMSSRVEEIQPGQAFKDSSAELTKNILQWKAFQAEWKNLAKRKLLKDKKAAEKKKAAEEAGEEAPAADEKEMDVDVSDVPTASIDNVLDIGNCQPLFSEWSFEDWALFNARAEMNMLIKAFKVDVNDPDRQAFPEKDLGFYYQRYFKKNWNLSAFSVKTFEDFVALIKDTICIEEKSTYVQSLLAEDATTSDIIKLTEEHRRERQRRADAGDESAELKFPRIQSAVAAPAAVIKGTRPTASPWKVVSPLATQAVIKPPALRPGAGGLVPQRPTVPTAVAGLAPVGGLKRPGGQLLAPASYVAKQPRTAGSFGSGLLKK